MVIKGNKVGFYGIKESKVGWAQNASIVRGNIIISF